MTRYSLDLFAYEGRLPTRPRTKLAQRTRGAVAHGIDAQWRSGAPGTAPRGTYSMLSEGPEGTETRCMAELCYDTQHDKSARLISFWGAVWLSFAVPIVGTRFQ